jgi:hypothetical protein
MKRHYYNNEGEKLFYMCKKCSLYPDYDPLLGCANCGSDEIKRRKANRAGGKRVINYVLAKHCGK